MRRARRIHPRLAALLAGLLTVALFPTPLLAGPEAGRSAEAPAGPGGDGESAFRTARVTYLTSRTVYVDAGSAAGLAEGQRLEIVREGEVTAVLQAEYVSSAKASCRILEGGAEIAVGDTVRFLPAAAPAPPPPSSPAPSADAPAPEARALRELGLRGRVGVRYLYVGDNMEGGATTSQPALDLRLDGTRVGGSAFDLEVDVRSRRTYRSGAGISSENEGRTSVYRLATAFQAHGSPWRVTAGRQFSPTLASVSIFDGVQGEYRAARWSLGAFSGTEPDPGNLGYSSSIRDHGGYVQLRNAPESERRWALTAGAIGSYEEGEISREFAYLQAFWYGPRLGLWMTQEVDYNRGWKTEYEDQSVDPTSTFLTVRYKVAEFLSLRAGYDNRRNVRLYRDRITPETEFDDAYRNGVWGGIETTIARHFRAGVEVKTRDGGELGSADSTTLTLGFHRLTRADIYVATRSTQYANERADGWLHSAALGLALGSRWHAELSGGVRDETSNVNTVLDEQITWYGMEVDVSVGRGWFLALSGERSDGDFEQLDQVYTSITWRF